MPSHYPFRRIPFYTLCGLLLVVVAILSGLVLTRQQADATRSVAHTIEVRVALVRVLERTRAFESAARGFMYTRRPVLLADAAIARRQVQRELDRLARLVSDNPIQTRNVALLRQLSHARMAFGFANMRRLLAGDNEAALAVAISGEGRRLMNRMVGQIDRMMAIENRLLSQRRSHAASLIGALTTGLAIATLVIITIAAMLMVDARRRYQAISEAHDEAREAAAHALSALEAREAAEFKVRQLQKMESIGHLTGGISHDFNNMLAIIIGSLDLAERKFDIDRTRTLECIANARDGAQRAATLTARLLAFSRQQPLAPVPIEANRMVSGMSELLRRTLGEQVMVETVLAGGLWTTFADPGQLESAILNLAVNARDAMPEGGRLTIETANSYLDEHYADARSEVTPGQYVVICVTDTGAGMSPEVLERAFDPFFTTKDVGKGTGLGLSQVFGFVKQSGGHVAIYSEIGEGTTVKLYLPRHQGAAAVQGEGLAGDDALPEGRPDELILVVEDEERVREFSVSALAELGYTAIPACDGTEALVILAREPGMALLFTDVVMPQMNGRKLADEARAICPEIRILYTTGYTRNAVVHNGMLDPGVAFLPKPFTIAQLAHKVRAVLEGNGSNRRE